MNTDVIGRVTDHLRIVLQTAVARAQCDMIGVDAEKLQALLHINADRAATAPQADNERRHKAIVEDAHAEPEGVFDQILLSDERSLLHARSVASAVLASRNHTLHIARMADKLYISAQSLLEDSIRIGNADLARGLRHSFILALWRAAAPIGIAVQEFLAWHGVETDHIAVRTSSYSGIDQQSREIAIYGMNYLIKNVTHADRLLIIDDVFDTGHTIDALIRKLESLARRNTPHDIRVAVPYYKPARNETQREPDYFLHETSQWLKFPHSLEGLSDAEIREHRRNLYNILNSARRD